MSLPKFAEVFLKTFNNTHVLQPKILMLLSLFIKLLKCLKVTNPSFFEAALNVIYQNCSVNLPWVLQILNLSLINIHENREQVRIIEGDSE